MNDRAHLQVKGIFHRFAEFGKWILDDVNVTTQEGEFVALVGASGSGKTTLLRIMAGLVDPTKGVVEVGSRVVSGTPDSSRAMVFQADRLFPWRTAIENVEFGLEIQRVDKQSRREAAANSLKLVGLGGHFDSYPSSLSGGMRQRVNLARALVLSPRFLLMDEPFSALDAQTRQMMQRELLDIWNETSAGIVFVTHEIEEALYLADRVVVLGGQPARVVLTVESTFERPRDLNVKRGPLFRRLYDQIWGAIEDDVKRAMSRQKDAAEDRELHHQSSKGISNAQ